MRENLSEKLKGLNIVASGGIKRRIYCLVLERNS